MIDNIICVGMTFDEFIVALIKEGCEVKRNKHIAIRFPGTKKNIRLASLGADYSYDALLERLSGKRVVPQREKISASETETVPLILRDEPANLLIDIQEKMRQDKGEGYRHWAGTFNLKQSAKTLIFLQDNDLADYNKLVKESDAVSTEYHNCLIKIKEIESRMKEISELQKYIGQYGKTREIYAEYKKRGWSKKYYADHESDIMLHRAAKKYFDDKGYGKDKKLPKMDSLKQEWATLNSQKKKLYSRYYELKDRHKSLSTARYNTERLLGITPDAKARDTSHTKHRSGGQEI